MQKLDTMIYLLNNQLSQRITLARNHNQTQTDEKKTPFPASFCTFYA